MIESALFVSTTKNVMSDTLVLGGQDLQLDEIVCVARHGTLVAITDEPTVLNRITAANRLVAKAVEEGKAIYGVSTGFGGMADHVINRDDITELQNNLIWYHKTGAGQRLPQEDVRAAMLLRANSHIRGASGVRMELIRRLQIFLNERVTPHVLNMGSIGASGDLVPLTNITGALIGMASEFTVDFNGEEMDSLTALQQLGLPRLTLEAKEGLAMINGTSVMTGIAVNCVHQARLLLALSLEAHALAIQALRGTNQSFHPFVHQLKPHFGQRWVGEQTLKLIEGSKLIRDEIHSEVKYRDSEPIQDRYSLRCLPQYMGPIVDGLRQIARQVVNEANSVNDNPLIDVDTGAFFHGGNFLGQYIGVAMDQLRSYVGLLAKHLDTQIALLMAPEFSNGLSPSLIGNQTRAVNMGMKGMQISGNSIMPLLTFFGNSLVDRFPTHAEQYNQNINSMGFGSANLARHSLDIFCDYMATVLINLCQAVDLRAFLEQGHYDARACLSPQTVPLYEAVRKVAGRPPQRERPYIWDDHKQLLEGDIARIAADIKMEGLISQATYKSVIPLN
jgi:phenylalanine ammonia-lyase